MLSRAVGGVLALVLLTGQCEAAKGPLGFSKLARLETQAGPLWCKPGLCHVSPIPLLPEESEMDAWSLHQVAATEKVPGFTLICTWLASGDPRCAPAFNPRLKSLDEALGAAPEALWMYGDSFTYPGDGCFYVEQRSNANYSQVHKYCYANGKFSLKEATVKVVDLKTSLNEPITLLAEPNDKAAAVQSLSKGERVHVLVEDSGWFFISDARGLGGWARPTISQCGAQSEGVGIRDICFNGD